jgi:hypothetical protein
MVDAEAFKAPSHDTEGLRREILGRLTDHVVRLSKEIAVYLWRCKIASA